MRSIPYITVVVPTCLLLVSADSFGAEKRPVSGHIWRQLVVEAEERALPTKFIKVVPPDFVQFEFGDLRAFAAEYHLEEHRMALNRTLSFNAAGRILRPLDRLTHGELETLYHELFHAYMDYAANSRSSTESGPLMALARKHQRCRYSVVLITPLVQRKTETEERYLSERESWEALNEAWAVFIGWSVWNQLEVAESLGGSIMKPGKSREAWVHRLMEADQQGMLRGYYEPEDPAERSITRKRFLAPGSRLTFNEIESLMEEALGYPSDLIQEVATALSGRQRDLFSPQGCE